MSFRGEFERDVGVGLARQSNTVTVTEADLSALPTLVQRYLRGVGVLGGPRVQNYRVRFHGRIRSDPGSRWMPFVADQTSFADRPTRLFLMRARMFGLPVEAFHQFVDGRARMRVNLLGVIRMVDATGDVMDRSETVTLFNDMCLLAPATLVDAPIVWEPVDCHTVRAKFANAGQTISAMLVFDKDMLINFMSDDRSRASSDGKTFTRLPFSTPITHYRDVGPARLASHGDARWRLPGGEFTYGEFDIESVHYNVTAFQQEACPA